MRSLVKVAVVGDAGVGKTSLISTAAHDTFDARPVPVLPPTKLPAEFSQDHVPMIVTDTSSSPEQRQVTDLVIQTSDVVILCFDVTRLATLDNVRLHWYPRIQAINPGVPIIMACCKSDRLEDEEQETSTLKERVSQSVQDLPHIEVVLNSSAKRLRMVTDVFFYALKTVLYPLQPLYDRLNRELRPLCVRALKRVFVMCDADGDGCLSDQELNFFQLTCFGMALDEVEVQNVKQIVGGSTPTGVTARGITLEGFLFLHVLFIERGRIDTPWTVLRKFGYNDELHLSDEVIDRISFAPSPDHVWELSDDALAFLVRQFSTVDEDRDGLITWQQVDTLFSTIPPPVWQGGHWDHVLVPSMYGASHKLEAFLLKWQLHAMMDPRMAYSHLLYLGYGGPDGSAGPTLLARGVRRKTDKKHRHELTARTCIQCLVFGPPGAGKTSMLRALIGEKPLGPLTVAAHTPPSMPATPVNSYSSLATSPSNSTPAAEAAAIAALSSHNFYNGTDDAPGPDAAEPTAFSAQGVTDEAAAAAPGVSSVPAGSHGMSRRAADDPESSACWTSLALVKSLEDDKERTLMLHEVSPELEQHMLEAAHLSNQGVGPLIVDTGHDGPQSLDLSKADVAAFVFDSSDPASFAAALTTMIKVSTLAGETLPCVLVSTKDELAMGSDLEAKVAAAVDDLKLRGFVRTSAALQDMGKLYNILVAAAVSPEGWIPDVPARRAQRHFRRQLIMGATGVTLSLGAAYITYKLISSFTSSRTTASTSDTDLSTTSVASGASKSLPGSSVGAAAPWTSRFSAAAAAPIVEPSSTPAPSLQGNAPGISSSSSSSIADWSFADLFKSIGDFVAALLAVDSKADVGGGSPTGCSAVNAVACSVAERARTARCAAWPGVGYAACAWLQQQCEVSASPDVHQKHDVPKSLLQDTLHRDASEESMPGLKQLLPR